MQVKIIFLAYGDSSDIEPSEDGLVADFKFVYEWVRNKTASKIYIWGHSLGTAVSTHGLSELGNESIVPAGLILESPFNNLQSEISEHPFSRVSKDKASTKMHFLFCFQPFKHLPWFMYTIVEPMLANNFIFASDVHIKRVNSPILILHAKDDGVVPYELGHRVSASDLQVFKKKSKFVFSSMKTQSVIACRLKQKSSFTDSKKNLIMGINTSVGHPNWITC